VTAADSSPDAGTAGIPLTVTMQILSATTGTLITERQVTLPPLGSTETPPDPCLTWTVGAATFALTTNLFVVRIALNPQPLPPGLCAPRTLAVTVQVLTLDSSGAPSGVRLVSFEPPDPCEAFAPS
jgi:hypothetical protein